MALFPILGVWQAARFHMAASRNIIFCWIVFLIFVPAMTSAGTFNVIRVYDGDTLTAYGHDVEVKVRLLGIDAPELSVGFGQPDQPFSNEAKAFLVELILNKNVDINGFGLDDSNRILGVISVNGMNVNLEMIKAGLAEVCRNRSAGSDIVLYRRAEADAQKAKRGMWSLEKYYVSPKDWRRKHEP